MSEIVSVLAPSARRARINRDPVELEIEQLAFLGLRMAFRQSHSRPQLRQIARWCLHRKLKLAKEWMAQRPFPKLQVRGRVNLHRAASQGNGVIIAACHVGQYHRIPLLLNDLGFPVALLLDEDNHAREQSEMDRWVSRYRGPLDRPVDYVNAELPTAAWKMSQTLRLGRVLFVYMDGGTGLQNCAPDKTSVEVKFCGLPLLVRRGLAHLSAFSGAPIVPAVAIKTPERNQRVTFYSACSKHEREALDAYCPRALQYCYSILEEHVLRDPACWEEWYHLHRWIIYPDTYQAGTLLPPDAVQGSLKSRFLFDRHRTEILRLPAGPVLFHTGTGAAIKLDTTISAVLCAGRRPALETDLIEAIPHTCERTDPVLLIRELVLSGFLRPLS